PGRDGRPDPRVRPARPLRGGPGVGRAVRAVPGEGPDRPPGRRRGGGGAGGRVPGGGRGAAAGGRAAADGRRGPGRRAAPEVVADRLTQAVEYRRRYRYAEARDALGTARTAAAGGRTDDRIPVVQAAADDLEFVVELDAVRMRRSMWVEAGGKGRLDERSAPA